MEYKITDKNLWLEITLSENERIGLAKALEEATEALPVLEERFAHLMGMRIVKPEENGDLTDAAILTDGRYDWIDNNYQIKSFINILAEEGTYSLMWARSHDMPLTKEEQIAFLLQFSISENILGLPLEYSFNVTNLEIVLWEFEFTDAHEDLFAKLSEYGLGYHIFNPLTLGKPVEFIDFGTTAAFKLIENEKGERVLSPTLNEVTDEELQLQTENLWSNYKLMMEALHEYKTDLEYELEERATYAAEQAAEMQAFMLDRQASKDGDKVYKSMLLKEFRTDDLK